MHISASCTIHKYLKMYKILELHDPCYIAGAYTGVGEKWMSEKLLSDEKILYQ